MYTPETEGIDHINMYSKSKTEIGRLISNFANTPFDYESYGHFESVEAFWYYYFTECRYEFLKDLSGAKAKKEGRKLLGSDDHYISELDKEVILEAIRCKLRQNRYILDLLVKNDLPIVHYYAYDDKIIVKDQYDWMTEEYIKIRDLMIKKMISDKLKNH